MTTPMNEDMMKPTPISCRSDTRSVAFLLECDHCLTPVLMMRGTNNIIDLGNIKIDHHQMLIVHVMQKARA